MLICLVAWSCSSGSENSRTDPAEGSAATRTFYAKPRVVLEAVKGALAHNNFDIASVQESSPGVFVVNVTKKPTNSFSEDVRRVVVADGPDGQTQVHIIIPGSLLNPWPDEPKWADAFFLTIFELMP